MESNNSNQERASNSPRALTPEEVLIPNDCGSNNQLFSYHRRFPDGEYVPVMLSPGYRFCPKDDELVVDFLNKEINKDRPEYIRILNVNVYNHSPEELASTYQSLGNGEWYFFSPREKKYANGTRPNRAAGNGYWKATGADKEIHRDGKPVGTKKCLVFYVGKPPKGDKTDWIMHEYVSKDSKQPPRQSTSVDMRLDDCVLCRIYKKSEHSPRTEEGTSDPEPGAPSKSEAGQYSSEGNNLQAARKRVKTKQHRGTANQQLINFQVPQITTQINFNPLQQKNLSLSRQNHQQQQLIGFDQVPQNINASPQNLSLSLQNQQQAIHHNHSLQGWSTYINPDIDIQAPAAAGGYNLGGHHRLETNPGDAQPIMDMTHPSFAALPPQQNLQQGMMQYSNYIQAGAAAAGGYINIPGGDHQVHYPQQIMDMAQANFASPPLQNQLSMQYISNPAGDYNLGGQQFDHRQEINPVPITIWPPNLPNNTHISLEAGSSSSSHINLDFGKGSIQEDANMLRYETDDFGNLSSYSQTFQNGFEFNDFYQYCSSTNSFTPIPPSLDADHDHPQNGEAIQGDKLVDRKPARSTTDNILYDHPAGEQS